MQPLRGGVRIGEREERVAGDRWEVLARGIGWVRMPWPGPLVFHGLDMPSIVFCGSVQPRLPFFGLYPAFAILEHQGAAIHPEEKRKAREHRAFNPSENSCLAEHAHVSREEEP